MSHASVRSATDAAREPGVARRPPLQRRAVGPDRPATTGAMAPKAVAANRGIDGGRHPFLRIRMILRVKSSEMAPRARAYFNGMRSSDAFQPPWTRSSREDAPR